MTRCNPGRFLAVEGSFELGPNGRVAELEADREVSLAELLRPFLPDPSDPRTGRIRITIEPATEPPRLFVRLPDVAAGWEPEQGRCPNCKAVLALIECDRLHLPVPKPGERIYRCHGCRALVTFYSSAWLR